MNHFERSRVPLAVLNDTDSANVVPAADNRQVSSLELHVVNHLISGKVHADSVVCFDLGIWIAESPTVVRSGIRDATRTSLDFPDAAELVARFLLLNFVQGKTAFGVVQKAEILLRFVDRDDILEPSRIEHVRPNLAIHLDESLHNNHLNLSVGQGILETLPEHDNEGQALTCLVWAWGGHRSPAALQLVQHPMLRCIHALQVLHDSARHPARRTYRSSGGLLLR